MTNALHQELIEQSCGYIRENVPRIEKCLRQLSHEQVWYRPNNVTNSIANLILHVCGNMTQYVVSSLGNNPDQRNRAAEFGQTGGLTITELVTLLNHTVDEVIRTLHSVPEKELLRVRKVQGFELSGVAVVTHVVEHFSYHTGQIVVQTKLLHPVDLGFYSGMDLNIANE